MNQRELEFGLVFNPAAPYDVLSTRHVNFESMQKLRRMARYWDLVANSGRFKNSLARILGDSPFDRFMQLSEWLHRTTGQTHKISLKRLFDLLFDALTTEFGVGEAEAMTGLWADYERSGVKGLPQCLRTPEQRNLKGTVKRTPNKRQRVHIGNV